MHDGSDGTREQQVGGFYDGDGRWILRFLPEAAGAWTFTTSSTARSLDAISGTLTVAEAAEGEHGPVRADGFHFVHADGTRHLPLGTTAYAWIHQAAELREATLRTLEAAPFTKLRMCVFPKSFIYNTNEPELYPFPGAPGDGFDITRFDPGFFRHLEGAVAELGRRGVQADVILFHPYDRWGFAELGTAADDRYVRYLVRRLSAYPNVWWSMANEYDFIEGKTTEDWERLAKVVRDNDPVGHLMSIHNGPELYDHSRQWITHASIQRELYPAAEGILEWRQRWGKPVVVDECSYEGDLEYGWGNISGPELVRRFWDSAVRGGYAGHGETYRRPRDRIWWSKGGELTGEAPARIAFLRRILEQAPGPLEPLPSLDVPHAGAPGTYDLQYFGINRPSVRYLFLPSDRDHQVDIIDTWNMTITLVPGPHRGALTIDLPAREYMALRITTLPA